MPGYASWKTLYREEYQQLFEEGYPVGEKPVPDLTQIYLPFPAQVRGQITEESITEAEWEKAYHNLWQVREHGIRPDYPYVEPDALEEILLAAGTTPQLNPLAEIQYRSRLEGAWYGRCAAVVLGKPLEMGYDRRKVREYLESVDAYPLADWVPARSNALNITLREDCVPSTKGNLRFVQPDDDVHYTILALLLAEKKGLSFTKLDVGENWLDNIPYHWFWCASRQIYYHMVNLNDNSPRSEQIEGFATLLNPWRECIDGQIRTDFWGYVCPGDPRAAAALAWQDCSLSLVKNGIYGGMFVAGCIAAALTSEPTVYSILTGGLSVIPVQSRLYQAVKSVMEWYAIYQDWEQVAEHIEKTYGHLPFAATINNLAMTTLALLHGNLDYTKTITTAVMCGIDTDCNSGTAGSIAGAAVGINAIDSRWTEPLCDNVKTAVASFGEGKISDLISRTISVQRKHRMGMLKE